MALMHGEMVERRRWLSERRFLHALNCTMVLLILLSAVYGLWGSLPLLAGWLLIARRWPVLQLIVVAALVGALTTSLRS